MKICAATHTKLGHWVFFIGFGHFFLLFLKHSFSSFVHLNTNVSFYFIGPRMAKSKENWKEKFFDDIRWNFFFWSPLMMVGQDKEKWINIHTHTQLKQQIFFPFCFFYWNTAEFGFIFYNDDDELFRSEKTCRLSSSLSERKTKKEKSFYFWNENENQIHTIWCFEKKLLKINKSGRTGQMVSTVSHEFFFEYLSISRFV